MFSSDEVRGVILKILPNLNQYYSSVFLQDQFPGEAVLTTIGEVQLTEGGRQMYWVAAFVVADDPSVVSWALHNIF